MIQRKIIINSDEIKYDKNLNIVYSKNSRAINLEDDIEIIAEKFEYNIDKENIIAEKNVILEDKKEDYKILSNFISYSKNEKIFSKGKTQQTFYQNII